MTPDRTPIRERLDQVLVSRGLARSRARARDAILRGHVTVDGAAVDRPATMVAPMSTVLLNDPAAEYVSRAAVKLIAGLDAFGYDPAGRVVLDLGASTGGFTQVLLERGAARVFAVDVGHGQLAPRLAADNRVVSLEGLNARDLSAATIGAPVGAITADLSFISLRLALPPALDLAARGAFAVVLVKPQFEVGRDGIGKGGIVRDTEAAERAATAIADWVSSLPGWSVDRLVPSPLAGGDGNREFLLGARHE